MSQHTDVFLLNGIDIREYDYEEYLAMFGVVFQDFKLFAMTVAENVAASESTMSGEIEEVLEKAGIWERVQKMEQESIIHCIMLVLKVLKCPVVRHRKLLLRAPYIRKHLLSF